jgi:ribose transport system ATP-binding protein
VTAGASAGAGPGSCLLEARGISKAFGPNQVLRDVSFDVRAGEVHALAGENGAGKSTLLNILSGVLTADAGELAGEARVATVHQELSLIGPLTVAENLLLGREPRTRFGTLDAGRLRRDARAFLAELDLELDVDQPVEDLPLSTQQLVEIAKALATGSNVILMDEPTSALAEPEAVRLFERIDGLRRHGKGIVYVSHRMEEIYRVADRITVLRDGRLVGTEVRTALPPARLVEWMIGRPPSSEAQVSAAGEDVVLRVDQLSVERATLTLGTRRAVDDLSFTVHAGEIVGLAGLRGSGASDVLHALFGDRAGRSSGRVELLGHQIDVRHPRDAIRQGLVLLTNDRKRKGLIFDMGSVDNATLATLPRFSPQGVVRRREELATTGKSFRQLNLRTPGVTAPVRLLSGGNQQKVVLAKCLLAEPKVMLLDEPTRGVDIGAKEEIYALLGALARKGLAILLITSELPELLRLSDRILVLHRGRLTAELTRAEATQTKVLEAALGAAA